ncbi:MAG: hypothetical protein GY705_06005 [Bacteroidetes bacterium]|nr:hypothetical protein [Bacteroidota bacterium]
MQIVRNFNHYNLDLVDKYFQWRRRQRGTEEGGMEEGRREGGLRPMETVKVGNRREKIRKMSEGGGKGRSQEDEGEG